MQENQDKTLHFPVMCVWMCCLHFQGFPDPRESQRDGIPAPAPSTPPSAIIIWLAKPLVLELEVHIYLDGRCVNHSLPCQNQQVNWSRGHPQF